jgi:hypothetical protein
MASAFFAIDRISRHNPRKADFNDQQKSEAGKRQILSKPEFKRALAHTDCIVLFDGCWQSRSRLCNPRDTSSVLDSSTKSRWKRRHQEMGIGNAIRKSANIIPFRNAIPPSHSSGSPFPRPRTSRVKLRYVCLQTVHTTKANTRVDAGPNQPR